MGYILLFLLGIAFSSSVSAGVFAFIASIGMVQRMAAKTKTTKHMLLYENMILVGAFLANIIYLFDINLHIGYVGLCIVGLFFGIFVGILAISLAETIKAFPIFINRIKLVEGLSFIIIALAIGKIIGSLFSLI